MHRIRNELSFQLPVFAKLAEDSPVNYLLLLFTVSALSRIALRRRAQPGRTCDPDPDLAGPALPVLYEGGTEEAVRIASGRGALVERLPEVRLRSRRVRRPGAWRSGAAAPEG